MYKRDLIPKSVHKGGMHLLRDAFKKSAKFRGFVLNWLTPYPPYLGPKKIRTLVIGPPPSFWVQDNIYKMNFNHLEKLQKLTFQFLIKKIIKKYKFML